MECKCTAHLNWGDLPRNPFPLRGQFPQITAAATAGIRAAIFLLRAAARPLIKEGCPPARTSTALAN
jgi:hypothetical protein